MGTKLLILKGSPREQGNSALLADAAAEGARAAGADVEAVFLHGLRISPCSACEECRDPGDCVLDDDMRDLLPKVAAADSILLATPIYWFTLSAQLKLCIDRWYAFQASGWRELQGTRFGVILTYGDTDLYTSGAINAIHTFETMARFLHSPIVGIVHGSLSDVGDVEKHPELLGKAKELGRLLGADRRATVGSTEAFR
jgi:multimeric flavodoxin WrbA